MRHPSYLGIFHRDGRAACHSDDTRGGGWPATASGLISVAEPRVGGFRWLIQITRVSLTKFPYGVGFPLRQAGDGSRPLDLKGASSLRLGDAIYMKTVCAFSRIVDLRRPPHRPSRQASSRHVPT